MYGASLTIKYLGKVVKLRPVKKSETVRIAEKMCNPLVLRYLGSDLVGTPEIMEERTHEATSKDETNVVWGIEYQGQLIGTTGIYKLSAWSMSCLTGVVIFETEMWRKGLTALIHPARMLIIANKLNRITATAFVRNKNIASQKALLAAGYHNDGIAYLGNAPDFDGTLMDTLVFNWINPRKEFLKILFPKGVPQKYKASIKQAKETLLLAEQIVTFG